MHARARQLLVAFLVCWMPFCCCQVKAAAAAVAHASHSASEDRRPPCCRARDQARHDAPAGTDDCCQDGGADRTAPKGSCCVACKERSLPPSLDGTAVPAPTVDAIATAMLADGWTAAPGTVACLAHADDTGPPPPGGRAALALHSLLLI